MTRIDSFSGRYRFLSNFFPCSVEYEGMPYPSTEHAYQAAKTTSSGLRFVLFTHGTPGEAKKRGRGVPLRPDWEQIKLSVMLELLRKKFSNPELRDMLLATGDAELIEGNTWGDRFWGVCNGVGENHLGKLLMQVREEKRKELS
jgi:N-glycosidase YbiA